MERVSASVVTVADCVLWFFHSICLKYCTCHEKVYGVLHLSCKITSANLKIWCPKLICNPSQEISARALTSQHLWWRCLLYCACHARCIFADPLQKSHACHRFWNCYNTLTFCSFLAKVQNPLRPPHKITIERPKVFRTCGAFSILTSKCASRHSCVHFFDISTSKSASNVVCFADFDFAMCFALQQHALFEHLNFQKFSDDEVFFGISTSKSASRHSRVQLFISHLTRWFRTRPFSVPTSTTGKMQSFATFLPFRAPGSSFF